MALSQADTQPHVRLASDASSLFRSSEWKPSSKWEVGEDNKNHYYSILTTKLAEQNQKTPWRFDTDPLARGAGLVITHFRVKAVSEWLVS